MPAPDGATTTKGCRAWRGYSMFCTCSRICSIEHLQLHRDARHLVGHRLGAERVGLAVELLAEEIEALAAGAALVEHAAEFRDVRGEALELLVHVDARGVEHDLLVHALVAMGAAAASAIFWPRASPGRPSPRPGISGCASATSAAMLVEALAQHLARAWRLRARASGRAPPTACAGERPARRRASASARATCVGEHAGPVQHLDTESGRASGSAAPRAPRPRPARPWPWRRAQRARAPSPAGVNA